MKTEQTKTIKLVITIILSILVGGVLSYLIFNKSCDNNNSSLPKPEITEGIRGTQFGIDKNIYEETIDNYLDRSDSVYRDMRMLKDPGNYEAIGGDAYLSGFVRGFEVVPYPYLVNVTGLPEEVGKTYEGETLFIVHPQFLLNAIYNYITVIQDDFYLQYLIILPAPH